MTVFTQAGNEVVRIGRMPRQVGSIKEKKKKADNKWGIFDMSGNVMEWCNDWHGAEYYDQCAKGIAANAGDWIKNIAPIVGGGGGGRADFAQAGGKDTSKIEEAKKAAYEYIVKLM